jgi:putative membrane protein
VKDEDSMSTIETSVAIDKKVTTLLSRTRRRFIDEEHVDAHGREASTDTEPDPRFTLANERTLLAWNRTSLALIGGGLAVGQLIDFSSVAGRLVASVTPVALGAVLAIVSLQRWLAVQRALRAGAPLPMPQIAVVLVVGICVLGVAIILSVVLDALAS